MSLRRSTIPPLHLTASLVFVAAMTGCTSPPPSPVLQTRSPDSNQTVRAQSGDVQLAVTLDLDRTDITVADRVILTLTATAPADAKLTLPPANQLLEGFNLISREETRQPAEANQLTSTVTLVLEPFLAGDKLIPEFTVSATRADRNASARTEPIALTVAAVAAKDASPDTPLNPAPTLVSLPFPDQPADRRNLIWPIAAAAVALSAIGLGGYLLSVRRRRMQTPAAQAHARLQKISAALDADQSPSASRDAILSLSATLRQFTVAQLSLGTPGVSTSDLARLAQHIPQLTPADRDALSHLTRDLEHASFAPGAATHGVARDLLERTSRWITGVSAYTEVPR